jgi:hypothetical protein
MGKCMSPRCRWVPPGTAVTLAAVLTALSRAASAADPDSAVEPAANLPLHPTSPLQLWELLPIQLSGFGDFLRRFSSEGPDRFELGLLELDVALTLVRNVMVSAGLVYDPSEDVFRLASFTVDGGLFGDAATHLFESTWLEKSGLILGKFDVPFGISYLHYTAPNNRWIALPAPVLSVHGAWNDTGVQAYAIASSFNLAVYWLNGLALAGPLASDGRSNAIGGRVGLRPTAALELGASGAWLGTAALGEQWLYGADLALRTSPFELESEYLARDPRPHGQFVQGFYVQALVRVAPAFAVARHEMLFEAERVSEHIATAGRGVEVLPHGEMRLVYAHSLETGADTVLLQVVGGSAWQPTGVRR